LILSEKFSVVPTHKYVKEGTSPVDFVDVNQDKVGKLAIRCKVSLVPVSDLLVRVLDALYGSLFTKAHLIQVPYIHSFCSW
jgi:hypothetical protein